MDANPYRNALTNNICHDENRSMGRFKRDRSASQSVASSMGSSVSGLSEDDSDCQMGGPYETPGTMGDSMKQWQIEQWWNALERVNIDGPVGGYFDDPLWRNLCNMSPPLEQDMRWQHIGDDLRNATSRMVRLKKRWIKRKTKFIRPTRKTPLRVASFNPGVSGLAATVKGEAFSARLRSPTTGVLAIMQQYKLHVLFVPASRLLESMCPLLTGVSYHGMIGGDKRGWGSVGVFLAHPIPPHLEVVKIQDEPRLLWVHTKQASYLGVAAPPQKHGKKSGLDSVWLTLMDTIMRVTLNRRSEQPDVPIYWMGGFNVDPRIWVTSPQSASVEMSSSMHTSIMSRRRDYLQLTLLRCNMCWHIPYVDPGPTEVIVYAKRCVPLSEWSTQWQAGNCIDLICGPETNVLPACYVPQYVKGPLEWYAGYPIMTTIEIHNGLHCRRDTQCFPPCRKASHQCRKLWNSDHGMLVMTHVDVLHHQPGSDLPKIPDWYHKKEFVDGVRDGIRPLADWYLTWLPDMLCNWYQEAAQWADVSKGPRFNKDLPSTWSWNDEEKASLILINSRREATAYAQHWLMAAAIQLLAIAFAGSLRRTPQVHAAVFKEPRTIQSILHFQIEPRGGRQIQQLFKPQEKQPPTWVNDSEGIPLDFEESQEEWRGRLMGQTLPEGELLPMDLGRVYVEKARIGKICRMDPSRWLEEAFTEDEVKIAIKQTKRSSAISPDCNSRRLVLYTHDEDWLSLIRLSLTTCHLANVYPENMRACNCEGRIKDPHASGLKVKDWRLIWVTSIWSIIYQRCQYNRVADRLSRLSPLEQTGYSKSCNLHLLTLDSIYHSRADAGLKTALLVCDLQSAFPRAWRELLLLLLWKCTEVTAAEWLSIAAFFGSTRVIMPFAGYAQGIINQGLVEGSIWGPRTYCLLPNQLIGFLRRKVDEGHQLGVQFPHWKQDAPHPFQDWLRRATRIGGKVQSLVEDLLRITDLRERMVGLLHCDDFLAFAESLTAFKDIITEMERWAKATRQKFHVEKKTVVVTNEDLPHDQVILHMQQVWESLVHRYLGILWDRHGTLQTHWSRKRKRALSIMETQLCRDLTSGIKSWWKYVNEIDEKTYAQMTCGTSLLTRIPDILETLESDQWNALERGLGPLWYQPMPPAIMKLRDGRLCWPLRFILEVRMERARLWETQDQLVAAPWRRAHGFPSTAAAISREFGKEYLTHRLKGQQHAALRDRCCWDYIDWILRTAKDEWTLLPTSQRIRSYQVAMEANLYQAQAVMGEEWTSSCKMQDRRWHPDFQRDIQADDSSDTDDGDDVPNNARVRRLGDKDVKLQGLPIRISTGWWQRWNAGTYGSWEVIGFRALWHLRLATTPLGYHSNGHRDILSTAWEAKCILCHASRPKKNRCAHETLYAYPDEFPRRRRKCLRCIAEGPGWVHLLGSPETGLPTCPVVNKRLQEFDLIPKLTEGIGPILSALEKDIAVSTDYLPGAPFWSEQFFRFIFQLEQTITAARLSYFPGKAGPEDLQTHWANLPECPIRIDTPPPSSEEDN